MTKGIFWIEPSCQIDGLDEIYQDTFGNLKDGVFVEIGAYDGRTYSNTWCLAELGWKGLYVEPIEHLFQACAGNHKDHPNVTVFKGWVGNGKHVQAYASEQINTCSPLYIEHTPGLVHLGEFPTITLNELLDVYEILDIDVLVIDVEGHEKEVLTGFSLMKHLPTLVIIEAHENHAREWMSENVKFINDYFQPFYDKVYSDSINNVYRLHNHMGIVEEVKHMREKMSKYEEKCN